MKAQKIKLTIEVEALDEKSMMYMVMDAMRQFHEDEKTNGSFIQKDGDQIAWKSTSTTVEF